MSRRLTRRTFLLAAAGTPLAIGGCRQQPTAIPSASARGDAETFTITYRGASVRCLFHDQLIGGARESCLLVVLLHGSGADATQWTDIGLVQAVDGLNLAPRSTVERVVAVAPDIADPAHAPDFVISTLLPHMDVRFGAEMLAISGVSSGAASSLQIARDHRRNMGSVGLHSPAIRLDDPIDPASWACYIDVGDDDPLAARATTTANVLRNSGIAVSEHHWPGGHNRAYWRQHLREYLDFHVVSARRKSP